MKINSPSRTRTYDPTVNSRLLYRLSYRGIQITLTGLLYYIFPVFASIIFIFSHIPSKPHTEQPSTTFFPKPSGQALDRLVPVSSMHCCTSTSDLSTSSSSRGLTRFCDGISHLEGGFTLRCLQRLSRPDLATLPWPW